MYLLAAVSRFGSGVDTASRPFDGQHTRGKGCAALCQYLFMNCMQADERVQWYDEQYRRLDLAIINLQTDKLLSNLDDMEKAPSAKQTQRLVQQAMGLRHLYFRLKQQQFARRDLKVWGTEYAQQREVDVADEVCTVVGLKSGSTILNWHWSYIKHDAHFPPDGRGAHGRNYLLSNEDLQLRFKLHMQQMAGDETLTVDAATEWVNEVLLNSGTCWDFATELTAFQELMVSHGHLAEMSPKCHPELAGVGVEYSWGKSKMHFRRHTDHVARHLHENIQDSMDVSVLTLLRVRRYARKARTYRRAYETSETAMSKRDIENMVKTFKRHRSALDFDWKFIKDS